MFRKLLDALKAKDDVEQVASKEDAAALNAYLKTRRLLIPRRPRQFLDASDFTREQLLEMTQSEANDMASDAFVPWILEVDGKKRLPAFSSQAKMETFAAKISQDLNKVFALGSAEVLIGDVTKDIDIDFLDLNLFSERSWEISVQQSDLR
jgi:hypothetical protein